MKRTLSLGLLVMLLLLSMATFGQDRRCAVCGNSITGAYIEADGKSYHENCYRQHILPRCAICGQPIEGRYTVYQGKNYHNHCYEKQIALRCAVCGGIIEGEHLIDHWGNRYHPRHEEELPSCNFCGRLICQAVTGGGVKYDSRHYICNLCRRGAISDVSEGRNILDDVRRRLEKHGIVIDHDDIPFQLVSPEQLAGLTGGQAGDAFGLAEHKYETMLGITIQQRFTIYLTENLPRYHFIATAAHELMHVWLYLNGKDNIDPPLLEGSCNYASFLVLEDFDNAKATYAINSLENDKDPVYGDGYRRVAVFVNERGVDGWLEYLEDNRYLPAGY